MVVAGVLRVEQKRDDALQTTATFDSRHLTEDVDLTLRTLEEDGFVVRTVYPEVPPRVEYTLTPRAESLLPHIEGLIGWAAEHAQAILHDRKTAQTHA